MASSKERPAPGDLALIQEFVNSTNVGTGREDLVSPEQMVAWFSRHGLPTGSGLPSMADVRRTIELREAIRRVLLANGGGSVDPEAVETLNRTVRTAQLGFTFSCDREARLEPSAQGIDGALGRLVAIIADAMAHGTWARLKACPDDHCLWAFYDYSKNRSGRWCTMRVCGNRLKARTFRSRHKTST